MKKLIFLLLVICMLATASIVLAAWEYKFPTNITDTSGSTRTYYPVDLGYTGSSLINAGYIALSGLDTNAQIGTSSIKYMLGYTKSFAVIPNLPAGGKITADLYTGYTPNQTNFPIIVGDNGYVLVADNVPMELANNFEIESKGYVDTTTNQLAESIVYKAGSFATFISDDNEITSAILSAEAARESYLVGASDVGVYSNTYLCQTFTPAVSHLMNRVEIIGGANTGAPPAGDITLSIRNTTGGFSTGGDLTSEAIAFASWNAAGGVNNYVFDMPVYVVAGTQYALILKYPNGDDGGGNYMSWRGNAAGAYAGGTTSRSNDAGVTWVTLAGYDMQFTEYGYALSCAATAINIPSGICKVITQSTGGGGNLIISVYDNSDVLIDDDTTALGGASCPDNANDWYIMWDDKVPYLDYYKHTVTGVLIAHYQPNTMILGQAYSTGTVTFINGSPYLLGSGTTWTSSMVGSMIKSNTDNIWHVVSTVNSNISITLTTNYTGGGGAHNYTMKARLPDREGALQDGIFYWGTNTSTTVVYGEMTSYESMSGETISTTGYTMPNAPMPSSWFNTSSVSTSLPFYDAFNDVATEMGMPVQTLYFLGIIGIAFALAIMLITLTRSAFVGVLAMVVVLFIGSSMTIIPMWIPVSVLLVDLGIMFLFRQMAY